MVRSSPLAIVIMAHNRPAELRRLLASITAAEIEPGTTLVVSIDGGGDHHNAVRAIAEDVGWTHGDATIVEHDRVGLVEHFHRCGDLTNEYDAIVLLEDDLVVGPAFHHWATAALGHAETDERIAGVSLAMPFFDGYQHLPFEPIIDGSDAIFAQVPWYDGMAWTHSMWQSYRANRDAVIDPATQIHRSFESLGDDEWFPDAVRYLLTTGKYYLLPRAAQATNSGAAGTHFDRQTDYFQVPLSMRGPAEWRVTSLDDSLAVYDDHLEPAKRVVKRLVPELAEVDFAVDLLGVRDLTTVAEPHVITTRKCDAALRSWGASLHPLVANLIHDTAGADIHLAETTHVQTDAASDAHARQTLIRHAERGREPSGRDMLRQLGTRVKRRLSHER